jgi:hypothetical protein
MCKVPNRGKEKKEDKMEESKKKVNGRKDGI